MDPSDFFIKGLDFVSTREGQLLCIQWTGQIMDCILLSSAFQEAKTLPPLPASPDAAPSTHPPSSVPLTNPSIALSTRPATTSVHHLPEPHTPACQIVYSVEMALFGVLF